MPQVSLQRSRREKLESLIGSRRATILVAALVAALVGLAALTWLRGAPATVAPPAVAPATASPAVASGESVPAAAVALSPSPSAVVYVHVAGAVRRPGLYELPMGARVADAIKAAHGPRRKAAIGAVNLAQLVADGSKIDVPRRGEVASPTSVPGAPVTGAPVTGAPVTGAPVTGVSPSPAVINLNSADETQLESIPGVGPVTAAAILAFRARIGSFTSVDQLLEVSGIGPATLESLRPYVSI